MTIRSAVGTHVGRVREHNEDNHAARPDLGLWIVADGMGGHLAGEVASRILVDELVRRITQGDSLSSAVAATHHAVLAAVASGEGQPGMGSTVVALQIKDAKYQIAWVGDSRAYLVSQTNLRQITCDHTFVQQLIAAGAIAESEAAQHPDRNIVTQAIGTPAMAEVKVDVVKGQLYQGEQILLCSDGLTGEVSDQAIFEILSALGDDVSKVEALIAAALDHGGSDNVTVLLVSAPDDAPARPQRGNTVPIDARLLNQSLAGNASPNKSTVIWAVIGGVCLAILLAMGWNINEKSAGRLVEPERTPLQISPAATENNPVTRQPKGETNAETQLQK
jgi:serine/threonine protein phosphatase PrpC